jgi:hydroxylysine kinase
VADADVAWCKILSGVLSAPAPHVTTGEAEWLAREFFGVDGEASPLGGERDRNFHLRETGGTDWVLKVVHPAEDPMLTDLHSRALLYLARADAGLPVPQVRMPVRGSRPDVSWRQPGTDAGPCLVRMYSYLVGQPMHLSAQSPSLHCRVGTLLGRLDVALAGLSHPAAAHDLPWDAHRAGRIRHLLAAPDDARLITALGHFAEHAEPALANARRQIIHNDFNPHNILTRVVDGPEVSGIIDFGDLILAPLVQDPATAAAYQVSADGHPLAGPAELITAYDAVCPLEPAEVELLFDLITARLVLSIAINGWHARRDPANRQYIMRNTTRARESLRRLQSSDCATATRYFQDALTRARTRRLR